MRPQSSTAMCRSIVTPPVSVSTSTTETCAPNGNVESVPSKSSSWRSAPGSTPSGSLVGVAAMPAASSAHDTALRGHTGHLQAAVADDDVVGRGLEQVGGDLLGPFEHAFGRDVDGAAGGLQRARAERARTARHSCRVGVDERDLVHRDAEHVAGEHRERGVVALAVDAGAGEHGGRAVVVDLARAPLDVQADRCGDLDVRRHADAELLGVAGCAARRLLGAQVVVARRRERGVERLLVLARVVVGAGDRGARERVRLHEVAPADLGRIDADLVGGDVEHALDQLRGLGAPGAAVGADGGVVGHHRLGVEPDLRDLVHADRHHLRQHRQDGADRRVGAGRRDHLAVEADDLAVVVHAEPGGHHVVAAVHQRDHVLGAGLDPLDRPAERQRGLGGDRGARRSRRPSGRTRRRPTGRRCAAARARGRAAGRRRRGPSAAPGATPTS